MLIKITQKGFEAYTGNLGMTEFVDGKSVDHISKQEAYALGAMVHVVEIDADGNELGIVSEAEDMVRRNTVHADVVPTLKRQDAVDVEDAATAAAKAAAETKAGIVTYTRDELEEIASAKGIAGIRDIADPLGIKGVAMKTLIAEILVHQRSN